MQFSLFQFMISVKPVSSDAMFDSLISGSVSKEAASSGVFAETAAPQKKQGRCDYMLVHTVLSVICVMTCSLALSVSCPRVLLLE
jgi:hypothetical protein